MDVHKRCHRALDKRWRTIEKLRELNNLQQAVYFEEQAKPLLQETFSYLHVGALEEPQKGSSDLNVKLLELKRDIIALAQPKPDDETGIDLSSGLTQQLENIFKRGKAILTGSVTAPMGIFSVDRNLAERVEEDARIDRALLEIQLAAAKLQAHADRLQI
ncbi:uncharacterized protein ISCGN_009670 [Ixodes scapularis]